jgi:nucleoside-diphosphate-sugar epimerase
MKVVIPGGSGQVGTVLARAFHGDGHDVIVLSVVPTFGPGASLLGMAQPSAMRHLNQLRLGACPYRNGRDDRLD